MGAHNICLSTVHHGWPCGAQRSVLRSDKIRVLGFTTLHDSRRYRNSAMADAWIPHTQTQRHGVLAMVNTPL